MKTELNRRNFLGLGVAAIAGSTLTAGKRGKMDQKPNIVLIMADDVSPEMFGPYAPEGANTPNLDRWAEEGVMFRTAWASSLCCPSRAMITTGCYATTTGYWSNGFATPGTDGTAKDLFADHPSFAKLLKKQGYTTAVTGKWHIGGSEEPEDPVVGFDEQCMWVGTRELEHLPGNVKHTGCWEDEDTTARYWGASIVENGEYIPQKKDDFGPDYYTDFLCRFMERSVKQGKPFLAYYPMVSPHGTRQGYPTCPTRGEPGRIDKIRGEEQDSRFRALNDYMDVLVGRLEKKTRELGVFENTIFIFCADNGTAVIAKSRGVERGVRVPFIVYGEAIKRRGPTDELCDLSDILPTLVDFAGGEIPPNMELDGYSLKPFLTGKSNITKDQLVAFIGGTRLMRTKTHMLEASDPLLDYPQGRFYYCGNSRDGDGYERVDNDPEHAAERKRFERLLNEYPLLEPDNPYFETKRGRKWLERYQTDKSARKHLHNHRDYQFYDEEMPDWSYAE